MAWQSIHHAIEGHSAKPPRFKIQMFDFLNDDFLLAEMNKSNVNNMNQCIQGA